MQEQVTAERLVSVVRVHADRVHDLVRRLGAGPAEAGAVVETSALDLVEAVAAGRADDALGWWTARARRLAADSPSEGSDVPVGEGPLAADSDQALLSRALESLPEPARVALLLRDSYDLPAVSVGAALGTTADGAMEAVGLARLAFLPRTDGQAAPGLAGHPADLAALARLGEGGPMAARDATTRRHAQACTVCRQVLEAQDYAHRLLSGLVVVALPQDVRDGLLRRVEQAARAALPSAAPLVVPGPSSEPEDDDDPRSGRLLTPLGVLLGLVLACAVGLGIGLLLTRSPGGIDPSVAAGGEPLVTAAPLPSLAPPPPEQLQRAATPPPAETRVFTLAPRTFAPSPPPSSPAPVPSPSASASPSASPTATPSLTVSPASGPNGADVRVRGRGWTPGVAVTLTYLDPSGTPTGSSATAVPDTAGEFTAALAAQDPANLPGPHEVRATNGTQQASGTYDAEA